MGHVTRQIAGTKGLLPFLAASLSRSIAGDTSVPPTAKGLRRGQLRAGRRRDSPQALLALHLFCHDGLGRLGSRPPERGAMKAAAHLACSAAGRVGQASLRLPRTGSPAYRPGAGRGSSTGLTTAAPEASRTTASESYRSAGVDRGAPSAFRVCPACAKTEAIGSGRSVWPLDWRCPACGVITAAIDGIPAFAPELAELPVGFDLRAYDRLVRQEPEHYWFDPRNRLVVGLIDRFFPAARHYLEVGCGTGYVLNAVTRLRAWESVTGSELHTGGLVHARRRLGDRAVFVQMDARRIPARHAFDLVGAYDVIEHIAEDEAVLESIRDSLVPGGGVVLAVPQHPWLWSAVDDLGQHVRRYRRGELEAKLVRAGFEILDSTSYNALLLPLMVVSRLMSRGKPVDDLVDREFEVSPMLNRTLRVILEAEVLATVKGLRWPIGGSRVVVARTT